MNKAHGLVISFLTLTLSACQPASASTLIPQEVTTTPEIYIPLDKAIPDYGIILDGVHLQITNAELSDEFPAGCTGLQPACTQAKDGSKILSVTFAPSDLPEGNMLAYKNLSVVSVVMEGGVTVPFSLSSYNNANHNLTIGFEVPADAKTFGLKWANLSEIPLNMSAK